MVKQLDAFLSLYSREAREIALCLRTLVLNVFPNAIEQIDPQAGMISYFRRKVSKEFVFAIAPHMKYVKLFLGQGADIPDPHRLLSGSGKRVRHVKIKSEVETQNPALRLMLEKAFKLSITDGS